MPTVLIILPEGFEEVEAITPIDVLRRAGAEVTVAALGETTAVKGKHGIVVTADRLLSAVPAGHTFDLLILPGGPGVRKFRADLRITAIVRAQATSGKWLAAICAAPTVLNDAGLLKDKRYTAHPSTADELKNILADQRVVIDGNLITSRGAGTSLDFGLTLVEKLFSPAKSAEIAKAICA
ncbi:protease [Nibricoccus aquaticus]|uniref:Protease n=1 Tax=Nibricoccus aquaticus TaxID=2576891 RepID=A0A290QB92_9BACT|nr:DJ-1 family glyoxalase III [Nibricoccus aquaticus]ATC65713.1 protease [Nibricoccus aquaticus]